VGCSLCGLGDIGAAHHFHNKNPPAEESHRVNDECYSGNISWPNYHSGANGDYQPVIPVEPIHDLLRLPAGGHVRFFPAHPHEGR
jgi:hypothetical protein